MGAGASTLPPTSDVIDKASVQEWAGDKFDEAAFDKVATDGAVKRTDLQAVWRLSLIHI